MPFCSQCGQNNDLSRGGRFCSGCGAPVQQSVATPIKKKKSVKSLILFFLVGLLLMVFGIQQMALQVIGQSATAQITQVRQNTTSTGGGRADPMSYKVHYEFFVNNNRYIGNAEQRFPHGVKSNETIRIRYLPMWPAMNSSDQKTSVLGGIFFLIFGIAILVLGITGKVHLTSRKR